MSGWRYKWVSYMSGGEFDRRAADKAMARGWRPVPVAELPRLVDVLDSSAFDTDLFTRWMRDFRLYRMTAEDHATLLASRPSTDQQLDAEFARFQHSLMTIAGGEGLTEIFWEIE